MATPLSNSTLQIYTGNYSGTVMVTDKRGLIVKIYSNPTYGVQDNPFSASGDYSFYIPAGEYLINGVPVNIPAVDMTVNQLNYTTLNPPIEGGGITGTGVVNDVPIVATASGSTIETLGPSGVTSVYTAGTSATIIVGDVAGVYGGISLTDGVSPVITINTGLMGATGNIQLNGTSGGGGGGIVFSSGDTINADGLGNFDLLNGTVAGEVSGNTPVASGIILNDDGTLGAAGTGDGMFASCAFQVAGDGTTTVENLFVNGVTTGSGPVMASFSTHKELEATSIIAIDVAQRFGASSSYPGETITGQGATQTVTVTGAATSGLVLLSAANADIGAGFVLKGWVSATNTVQYAVVGTGTTSAATINIWVIQ